MLGGIMLGLGRALGETMAVTFVIGNAHRISSSLLAPGTTISSAIANEFTEAVGDLYTSSLIALGLLLFLITFAVHRDRAGDAAPAGATRRVTAMNRADSSARRAMAHFSRCRSRHTVGLACLAAILWTLVSNGIAGMSSRVFTQMTPPPGPGGLLNALYGSAIMTLLGICIGSPIGMLAGTYLCRIRPQFRA
jgi:ABC-type phosphate transport system permease subunit